jgi:hypothetical protein
MESLVDMSFQWEWEPFLAALLRNDASVTTVDLDESTSRMDIPSLYGRSLGSALLHNTMVTSLSLDVSQLLPEDSNAPIVAEDLAEDWALLLRYIETSTALRTVGLCLSVSSTNAAGPIGLSFAKKVLHAAASNTNIRALKFGTCVVYEPQEMIVFLNQPTMSLKELELDISGNVLSRDSRQLLVTALATNAQLDDLALFLGGDTDDVDDVEAGVLALHDLHQNKALKKLQLHFDWSGSVSFVVPGCVWSSLLQIAPLRCLGLSSVSFDGNAMEDLLKGLVQRDTVIDLELSYCFFGHDAVDTLVRFVASIPNRLVSKLTVVFPDFDHPGLHTGMLVQALYPVSGVCPFQHLAICLNVDMTCGLLDLFAVQPPRQMTSLDLPLRRETEIVALAAFVKSAVHLKNLSVDFSCQNDEDYTSTLLEALRVNGSVMEVGDGLPFVYCLRNESLPLLLGQRPLPSGNVLLIPKLFHASKTAKKMAPNTIFMGLLGFDSMESQHRDQKRTCLAMD